MPGSTTNASAARETALKSAAMPAADLGVVVGGPEAATAVAEVVGGATAADLAARIARASALAHINAPAAATTVPVPYETQTNAVQVQVNGATQEVPVIVKPSGFSGVTHEWFPGGEPYRVSELSFPCLVPFQDAEGKTVKLYQVATFGDVVVLDEATALFGLKHKSIQPIAL